MDHLPLPRAPVFPPGGPLEVPYVCADRHAGEPYDNGDFLEYPLRAGKPNVIPGDDHPNFEWLEQVQPSNDRWDLEPFFQSWMFFGLLREALSPAAIPQISLYSASDYINGRVVHTSKLAAKIGEWSALVAELTPSTRLAFATRLFDCLHLVHLTTRCLWKDRSVPSRGHPGFNRNIRLSLAVICETFSCLGDVTFAEDACSHIDWPRFDMLAPFDDAERADLLHRGWCPHLLSNAQKTLRSVAGHYYLRHLPVPVTDERHETCTEEHCASMQIIPEKYRPLHVDAECDCDLTGPNLDQVAECLDTGTFPVLEVTGDSKDDVHIRTIPYRSDTETPYVAFSHVWAHGLGNPHALELAGCQVLRLAAFVKDLDGRSFKYGEEAEEKVERRKLYLWCDSLLCPIQKGPPEGTKKDTKEHTAWMQQPEVVRSRELKNAALAKMPDVYSNSAHTIVVDRSLTTQVFEEIGPLEATVRILISGWAQRLWTYQESVLPPKLLVQYADGPVEFRDLWQHVTEQYRGNPPFRGICRDLAIMCVSLRAAPSRAAGLAIDQVQANVGRRGLSQLADEPLCTATLLGLNTGDVAKAGDDAPHRMAKFWQMLSESERGFTDGIVFNDFVRLSLPGYRWAPATFRQPDSAGYYFVDDPTAGRFATVSKDGLVIRRPGWRIKLGKAPWFSALLGWTSRDDGTFLHVKVNDQWYNISESKRYQTPLTAKPEKNIWEMISKSPNEDWTVLLDVSTQIQGSQRALLGFPRKTEGPTVVLQARMLVTVNPVQPVYSQIMSQAMIDTTRLRRSWLFSEFQFCCLIDRVAEWMMLAIAAVAVPRTLERTNHLGLQAWSTKLVHDWALMLLPFFVHRIVVYILGPLLRRWHRSLINDIVTRLKQCATTLFNSNDIAKFLLAMDKTSNPESLIGHFMLCLTNRLVYVTALYPEDHTWCVD